MALFVNTNHSALRAMGDLSSTQRSLSDTFRKISSGQRVNRAADDAAGLAVAENLDAKEGSARVANRNIQDGISVVQTYEGAADEVASILKRQRELAVQASSETLADTERAYAQEEFEQLSMEHQRVSRTTEFNGQSLAGFDPAAGSPPASFVASGAPGEISRFEYDVQAGVNNSADDRITLQLHALDLDQMTGAYMDSFGGGGPPAGAPMELNSFAPGGGPLDPATMMNVTTAANAQGALGAIDFALDYVNSARSKAGASQNRLESALNNLETFTENTAAAESRIRDADFAFETAEMSKLQVMQQAGTAILGQANGMNQAALRLI